MNEYDMIAEKITVGCDINWIYCGHKIGHTWHFVGDDILLCLIKCYTILLLSVEGDMLSLSTDSNDIVQHLQERNHI